MLSDNQPGFDEAQMIVFRLRGIQGDLELLELAERAFANAPSGVSALCERIDALTDRWQAYAYSFIEMQQIEEANDE